MKALPIIETLAFGAVWIPIPKSLNDYTFVFPGHGQLTCTSEDPCLLDYEAKEGESVDLIYKTCLNGYCSQESVLGKIAAVPKGELHLVLSICGNIIYIAA